MNAPASVANPAEIAREAIRRLASSRTAPTPENFARAYGEASGNGVNSGANAIEADQVLTQLVQGLVAFRPDASGILKFQEQVKSRAWKNALSSVSEAVSEALSDHSQEWPRVLSQLLAQLDSTNPGWTRARKLGAVRHVLATASAADRTREKLARLVEAWTVTPLENAGLPLVVSPAAWSESSGHTGGDSSAEGDGTDDAAGTPPDPEKATQAWRLLALTALDIFQPADRRRPNSPAENNSNTLGGRLARHAGVPGAEWLYEIQSACMDSRYEMNRQEELHNRLTRLLRRICENLALFADDDTWVSGQVERIVKLLDAPLDEHALNEAEDSLQRAVWRQAELKADLKQAKTAVKEMLASLIERLAAATTSTGEFHDRIGDRVEAIRQAHDLPSLTRVVASLLDDTLELRNSTLRTHDDLCHARKTAEEYELRMKALEQELADVSDLVRVDPLTQVLNRRGLDDIFAARQARALRDGKSLAVALLDIDNFKCLNDSLGHHAGDLALKHVSEMIRGELRPNDVVARFGGEEFVILLDNTSAAEGINALRRLQRQLTRAIFLHNDEKILITFSAGIADLRAGESQESVLQRADSALYKAKAAGKNCVQLA